MVLTTVNVAGAIFGVLRCFCAAEIHQRRVVPKMMLFSKLSRNVHLAVVLSVIGLCTTALSETPTGACSTVQL